jgi:hypothetical protein
MASQNIDIAHHFGIYRYIFLTGAIGPLQKQGK